jgi:site-specific DNA recombinase
MPPRQNRPRPTAQRQPSRNDLIRSPIGSVRRCAIYTRKSTEEGLDQDFNSLQAQREACEAYIASQRHEGWALLPSPYEAGGFSGGSMERPGLQALLADVDAGRVDVVVVYKVDRLTRSLTDFAKIVERFDRRAVSFVSVTQAFNTTTSMGRLTLNVLLSFAQFEREVGAERVRDKVAASRRKGMWMGGAVPLGYTAQDRKLVIVAEEAATVRLIFELYLELGSTTRLLAELNRRAIRTARRVSRHGRVTGGVVFGPGTLHYLLKNRTYVGDVVHKGEVYAGEHEAILDRALFEAVQQKLASQAPGRGGRPSASPSLLVGRIYDSNGNRMSPANVTKQGVRYRYYVSRALAEGRKTEAGNPTRVPAPEIEAAVVKAIRGWLSGAHSAALPDCHRSDPISPASGMTDQHLVERHLKRLAVMPCRLLIELEADPEREARDDELNPIPSVLSERSAQRSLRISVQWQPTSKLPVKSIVEGAPSLANEKTSDIDCRRIAHAIQTGRNWLNEIASGQIEGLDAIAKREGKHVRTIRSTIAFSFLAPDLVDHLLTNGLPAHWTLSDVTRQLPRGWNEQRRMLASHGSSGARD